MNDTKFSYNLPLLFSGKKLLAKIIKADFTIAAELRLRASHLKSDPQNIRVCLKSVCELLLYNFVQAFLAYMLKSTYPGNEITRTKIINKTSHQCFTFETFQRRKMAEVPRNLCLPSGYDEDFVNQVDEDFICAICQLPTKNPILTRHCGHRFCGECIEEHLRRYG